MKQISSTSRLYALYGQTEHSFTAGLFIDQVSQVGELGQEIKHVTLTLKNTKNNLFDLFIESPYLFKGYLVPKGCIRTGKPFNTGDLVCLNDHKRLIIVGRNDRVVKIRGFRVNLEEIECVVQQVITTIEFYALSVLVENQQRLIDVYDGDEEVTLSDINACISKQLPEYNLLHQLLHLKLNQLPVTETGKRDRRKLEAIVKEKFNLGGL